MSTPPSRLQQSAGSPEGAASPASGGRRRSHKKGGSRTTGTALPGLADRVAAAALTSLPKGAEGAPKKLSPPPSPRTVLPAGAGAALAMEPHFQRITTAVSASQPGSRQTTPRRAAAAAASTADTGAPQLMDQLASLLAESAERPPLHTNASTDSAEPPPRITVEGASLLGSPGQAAAAAAEEPGFQSPQGFLAPQTSPSSHQQPPTGSTGRAPTLSPLSPSQQLQLAEAATLTPPPASAPLPLALQTEDAHTEGAAPIAAAADTADLPPVATAAGADTADLPPVATAAGADTADLPPVATAAGADTADLPPVATAAGAGSAGNEGAAAAAVAADPTPPPGAVRRPGPNRNGSHSDGEADDERSNVAPLGGPLATTPTAGSGAAPIATTRQKTERVWSNCVSALSVAVMGGAVLGAMWIYQIDQQNGDSM